MSTTRDIPTASDERISSPPVIMRTRAALNMHEIITPQHHENTEIMKLRQQYIREHQLPTFVVPDVDTTADILNAMIYDASSDQSFLPSMQASYRVLIDHLVMQFQELCNHGYSFYASEQPYENSADMLTELQEAKTLRYLPSTHTESIGSEHLMMQSTELVDDAGNLMTANDVFRCVHDSIAHGAGYSFGFSGEKGAWLTHRQCLPEAAHLALWNETRGQNAWTNAGPHMRKSDGHGFYTLLTSDDSDYLPPAQRPFPAQKSVVVAPRFI